MGALLVTHSSMFFGLCVCVCPGYVSYVKVWKNVHLLAVFLAHPCKHMLCSVSNWLAGDPKEYMISMVFESSFIGPEMTIESAQRSP